MMNRFWVWLAVASTLLLSACFGHRHHRDGGDVGTMAVAGVRTVALTAGGFLPQVDREPLVVKRGTLRDADPIEVTFRSSAREAVGQTVRIRINGYLPVTDASPKGYADALRKLAGAPGNCPLAGKDNTDRACECNSVADQGLATCKFRSAALAVFKYDICVKPKEGQESCLDPTGMIN